MINKKYYKERAMVIELELSNHQAQGLPVLLKNHTNVNQRLLKRHFGEDNISELKCLLNKVSWQEVFSDTEVNAKFKVFVDSVLYYFDSLHFPVCVVNNIFNIKLYPSRTL
jgi:hypothetical protein